MKWEVIGAIREDGRETMVLIEAETEASARRRAFRAGIIVAEIAPAATEDITSEPLAPDAVAASLPHIAADDPLEELAAVAKSPRDARRAAGIGNAAPMRRRMHPLSGVSVAVGGMALLASFVPNAACVSVPSGVAGVLLGLLTATAATVTPRWTLVAPVVGIVISASALVVVQKSTGNLWVAMTDSIARLSTRIGRTEAEPRAEPSQSTTPADGSTKRQEAVRPLAAKAPKVSERVVDSSGDILPSAKGTKSKVLFSVPADAVERNPRNATAQAGPSEGRWAGAAAYYMDKDIGIRVVSAEIKKVRLTDERGDAESKNPLLAIVIEITNRSPTRELAYSTWRGSGSGSTGDYVSVDDDRGMAVPRVGFPGSVKIADAVEGARAIAAGANCTDLLVFEVPNSGARELRIELPAKNVRKSGAYLLKLPTPTPSLQK